MTAVTVIIPVHDGAEFVAEAIESVLGQTLRDCRIIAVDDGSTDATPAVLARFGSRIRVVRHEKRGLSAARNGALALADGEYVAFLDHDDLWEPAFLERGVAQLAAAPDRVAGAVAGWLRIDRDGRELPGTGVAPRGFIGLRELVLGNRFACGAVVLRRRALVESGGFDAELRAAEDWDLWLRLAASGWQFATVGACLWRYRLHGRNMSHNADALRQGALRTLEKLFAHPALPPDVRACRARAVGNVFLHASEALYATGREAEARRDFAAAVETCPDLLRDDETYYSIVCAEQPPGYKASPVHLDLMAGQQRILQALSACRDGGLIDAAVHRRAMGRAYRALAALAFGQRRMRDVRRYAGCALRADAALWRDRRTLMPALKSLAGAQLVDAVSRWRQRAGARPSGGGRMTAVGPDDASMAHLMPPLQAAIDRCALDLSGLVVFTEAASGAYIVTPVLAALAGARQVFALARPSRYGGVETVARATLALGRLAEVERRIEIVIDKRADWVAAADIVTNAGHVRPIDAAMIDAMKPTAVIPLMYEAWEFRPGDVDLDACARRGIAVAGTNERHPAVDVFAFLGPMALRLLSDAGVDAAGRRILLWCDNPFAPFLQRSLAAAGARVDTIARLDDAEHPPADAVLVAVRPRAHAVVADREARLLARQHPGALVAQFWGDMDRAALARAGLPFWPLEAPPLGHQGILPSGVGPEPIVRLQSGGLKVGEVMARARADGAGSRDAAVAAAVASGFGQALAEDATGW